MRVLLALVAVGVSADCVAKPSLEESVVQWFCERTPEDPVVRIAKGHSVSRYACRDDATIVYLGERDAGCSEMRTTTRFKIVVPANELGQIRVEEYLIPSCPAYDHDWLLGADLLERSGQGLRSVGSYTY